MKRFLFSVVLATTLALASCKFDDSDIWSKLNEYGESIRDHEQRISALEELCKQMNTNIEALQTLVDALEKRDYVTNVSEVRSNGEVIGYTISFAYSDTITIYHGKDGKDGADGKDGYTPQIGVMKDTNGIYYWTLDGEWLLDGKGNKIKAIGIDGADGKDGADGTNGTNGANGVTPQLKIENDYWYVSYDNGTTWQQLGKATGEDGTNGEDGDSIFNSVTQDDEYVYFNLSDGTMITLPKHDKKNIQFEDLQVKALCCKYWDTNTDGELSYDEAATVTSLLYDQYNSPFHGRTNIIAFTELKHFTGLTEIPVNAFYGCTSLWKVVLPKNVEKLYSDSFNGCENLISINIPKKVKTIEYSRGYFPQLKSVYIEDLEAWCRISFNNTSANPLADGANLYVNGEILTELIVPTSIKQIQPYAFYNCNSLTKVVIPDSVTAIGGCAFNNCGNLEVVTIGKGVKSIEGSAFTSCPWLRYIYCKCTTPPKLYYDYSSSSFPITTGMKIYVPRNSYNAYTRFTSYSNGSTQDNWYVYKEYILPYDFE